MYILKMFPSDSDIRLVVSQSPSHLHFPYIFFPFHLGADLVQLYLQSLDTLCNINTSFFLNPFYDRKRTNSLTSHFGFGESSIR